MHILQSTVERLLYVLLFLIFIGILIVGSIAYEDGQAIKQIITTRTSLIQTVEVNQKSNALAIKTYIACLLTLNPAQTPTQIQNSEQTCFDNAPQVK
jgi:hypothetical protein